MKCKLKELLTLMLRKVNIQLDKCKLMCFFFYAGYTYMTLFLFSLTYGKELTTAAVNMQVAKQQASVKWANDSSFLNKLILFFSCYGKPVSVSDNGGHPSNPDSVQQLKAAPLPWYIKAAENSKAWGSDSIWYIPQLFPSLRRRYLTPSIISVNCFIWINKTVI